MSGKEVHFVRHNTKMYYGDWEETVTGEQEE